jgi:hypothetical protein
LLLLGSILSLIPGLILGLILDHQLSQRLHCGRNFLRHVAVYLGHQIFFLFPIPLRPLLGNLPLVLGHAGSGDPRFVLVMLPNPGRNAAGSQNAP